MKFPDNISLLVLSLFISVSTFAQNTSIKLVNSNTEEALPYANVALYNLDGSLYKGFTTDNRGIVRFDLSQQVTFQISFVGFEMLEGQIGQGEQITLEMIEEFDMLDAIVVTGQYGPRKADQSIYKIDVVDDKQMQQRGVNNLAEALSQETFIRLVTDPSTGTSLEMQGMGEKMLNI